MGHTLYYSTSVEKWKEFTHLVKKACRGLEWEAKILKDSVVVRAPCNHVEMLVIEKNGKGFVKTNLVEPCHSIYLLILYSVAAFGSVSLWED